VFTLFDKNKDEYAGKEEFLSAACRLLSRKFEDKIKIVFEIYDFNNNGIISREDIRVLLSSVPLAEILADKKSQGRREGTFTRNGGG
jgi:Ca2+-binding EF-hand superfamily protein